MDSHTISILNLHSKISECSIDHHCKIVSIQFNSNATKLLIRDKEKSLYLYDIRSREKFTMLNFTSFCRWVPESDVIVA